MKFLLFEKSAIECITGKSEFQSIEFPMGETLVSLIINPEKKCKKIDDVLVYPYSNGSGLFFTGKDCDFKHVFVFDLKQSGLNVEGVHKADLLLLLQKSMRTAIRIWLKFPFSFSERVNGSKSILFPFAFPDPHRLVIERTVESSRLRKRGIDWPLLAYKYGTDDAPRGEEHANCSVLQEAAEYFKDNVQVFREQFTQVETIKSQTERPLVRENASEGVSDKGFRYLSYEKQLSRLTTSQKSVVMNDGLSVPIRVEGPAGTGKTASMILRAYKLLNDARSKNEPFNVIFFTHSESTYSEIFTEFSTLEDAKYFLDENNPQHIRITSLLNYCMKLIRTTESMLIDRDASEAKQNQLFLIEDALSQFLKEGFTTYAPLLSPQMRQLFTPGITRMAFLVSMLQHEFGIQIKGRTNSTIEEYLKLKPITNGLPINCDMDKKFIFSIFKEYQERLLTLAVYDCDDIAIEALSQLNAPFWRRERVYKGFDYIFVDEMHLFNINEQSIVHYLTKSSSQESIPICFALDYGQSLGDYGDRSQDYIECTYAHANKSEYQTVFRSSQQITDFCASISASGTLMFQDNYRNSYSVPTSGFTTRDEALCEIPSLIMYSDDERMLGAVPSHIRKLQEALHCKNNEIAVVSFDSNAFTQEVINQWECDLKVKVFILRDRMQHQGLSELCDRHQIVLAKPQDINGLEFAAVILLGVDEGRVPQTVNTEDISLNYLKYMAFNQIYLSASRAKYRLLLLGSRLHGVSSCLKYAIERKCLQKISAD